MEKEQKLLTLDIIDDYLDLLQKEIINNLKPNELLIDEVKNKLDLLKGWRKNKKSWKF